MAEARSACRTTKIVVGPTGAFAALADARTAAVAGAAAAPGAAVRAVQPPITAAASRIAQALRM